ncbi:hypothetical protein [Paracoccus sp. J55]|uniref:hypothetical protein n=1 Tax=Paracoccus sp. J55 TaxID=935849 RepID=UPI00048CFF44|nr:hypothetical protein [Paracoccus sp. J55]
MIRLNLAAGPKWFDLFDGVRFKLRPASSTIMAEARGSARLQKMVEEDASNEALSICLAKEVARLALDEWEGICDEDGKPMEPSPEAIDAALDIWPVFEGFQLKYMAAAMLREQEKNGSAPSQNGTSAGATATAKAARSRAKSAPTKSTARKR